MTKQINYLESKIFDFFLSNNSKKNIEKYVLVISIVGFIFHLLLIYLNKFEIIKINDPYNLLNNPISAVYTPFSFILVYEIYLLIYYLPRSISTYISKQFEIITLIVIRRIFKKILQSSDSRKYQFCWWSTYTFYKRSCFLLCSKWSFNWSWR